MITKANQIENVENVETTQTEESKRDSQEFSAVIMPSVFVPNSVDRLILKLDTKFLSYDDEGKKVLVDNFGVQVLRLYQIINHKVLNKVLLLTMGKRTEEIAFLMGQILLVLLVGQKTNIKRLERFAKEKRKETEDLYTQDCYTLEQFEVKFNESIIDYDFINDLMGELKEAVKNSIMPKQINKINNPFNI